jgi:septal ring factor EnvC (AmiA/AmiB activator)
VLQLESSREANPLGAPPDPLLRNQVARLSRELEALEEARTRAREEAQRAEQARIQLEAEMKVGAPSFRRTECRSGCIAPETPV